jgi:choline dehydrogenase-like flavoprotein
LLETYKGVPIDSRLLDFARPDPDRGFPRGFVIASMGAPDYLQGPAAFALWIAPGYGRAHRRFVEKHYGAHAMIYGIAEQGPREGNALTLDPEQKDPWGVPKARVDARLNVEDCTLLALMRRQCAHILEATGGTTLLGQYSAYDISRATHAVGTARMGTHKDNSVVDAFCRCHDIPNLYIMDGSVLPTQGCGCSPSLTIQALALRAAEKMASCHGV